MPYLKKTYFAGKTIEMQNHVLPYLQSFCSLEEKVYRSGGYECWEWRDRK